MTVRTGIFGHEVNLEERILSDRSALVELVRNLKGIGLKIVLTSGTWDVIHVGHYRYLAEAKKHGDILIVGVDSDARVKARKGPHRPVVSQDERMEILAHSRSVDILTLKEVDDPSFCLPKMISPDVLVVSKSTKERTEDEKRELVSMEGDVFGRLVELEPQATTSTTARVRNLHISGANILGEAITRRLPEIIQEELERLSKGGA